MQAFKTAKSVGAFVFSSDTSTPQEKSARASDEVAHSEDLLLLAQRQVMTFAKAIVRRLNTSFLTLGFFIARRAIVLCDLLSTLLARLCMPGDREIA